MIDLDELERLCREATPGPWVELEGHPYLFANARGPEPWHHDIVGRFDYHSEQNRAFIAALRNAAPELIAMARRYQWLRAHRIYENSDGSLRIEFHCMKERHMNDFNAAIDAAMQEQKT